MASKEELRPEEPQKVFAGCKPFCFLVFHFFALWPFETKQSHILTADEEKNDTSKLETDENSTDGSSGQNSPRGVLEIPISSVHSDGGSSSESSSSDRLTSPVLESHISQWRSLFGRLLRKKRSVARPPTSPPAARRSGLERKGWGSFRRSGYQSRPAAVQLEVPMRRPSWRNFDYQELALATNFFSHDNLIGKGGHAEVYKGCLTDGQLVAVKRLTKKDKEEERIGDFLSELGIIAHVNHPNAAQLLGFGVDGGLHLILQYSPHGSLASVLHGSKESLKWKFRFDIALGIAEGLCYLHEGCQRHIIHRDIKASNILLTQDYQPQVNKNHLLHLHFLSQQNKVLLPMQISDFGLAKWLPDKWTHHVAFPIEGTFGYMAPEYFMHGVVNEKTDVFAFGVLLLELVTGRRAVDSSRQSLVIWAKPFIDADDFKGLADPSFGDDSDSEELKRAILVASMCIHHVSTSRPNMNMVGFLSTAHQSDIFDELAGFGMQAVRLLRGEVGNLELMGRAPKPRLPLFDACGLEDYTCSRYLSDLHRHKQLALEQ